MKKAELLWERFKRNWQGIVAILALIVSTYDVCQSRRLGEEATKLASASWEWQRQVEALGHAQLSVTRKLEYTVEQRETTTATISPKPTILGTVGIYNDGPARAVYITVDIETTTVALAEEPEFTYINETGRLKCYEACNKAAGKISDIDPEGRAEVSFKFQPSAITWQEILRGSRPAIRVYCDNCNDPSPKYEDFELANFPELPAAREYSVLPGDSLTDIADRYGVTIWDLFWWNPGLEPSAPYLKPGEIILIPEVY